ncbi:hypothetical protein D3C75_932530 [compost metagenome]
MPTAATPLSDNPISARIIKMPCQLVIMVESSVQIEASKSAVTITGLRPIASESGPVNSRPMANVAVETDNEILLLAGDTPNSCDRTGKMGWTQ